MNFKTKGPIFTLSFAFRIFERKFVLKPWSDIAPEFTLPSSSATISDLLVNTADSSEIRMVLVLDKEGMI